MLALALISIALSLASPISAKGNTGCRISHAVIDLPQGQTVLAAPDSAPRYIGLGVGIQNYTCNAATSKYTSVGAVAELADVSCLDPKHYPHASQYAYSAWAAAAPGVEPSDLFSTFNAPILGQHYFIQNGAALSPKWDFSAEGDRFAHNPNAFVVAAKVGDLPAPTGATDVDWLQLKEVSGELATTVYRVDTRGGTPPPTCSSPAGEVLSVKYTSIYWFYGGSLRTGYYRRDY